MKKITSVMAVAVVLLLCGARAAVITVNTTDNTNFGPGMTNLVTALTLLTNNSTINFNLAGSGTHYILTPPGGYPIMTNLTNVTINGYSQPGSSANTASILSSNNANITVYLDSSNGECTDLTGINGYDQEGALLSVLGCTNVSIGGLGFLGPNPGGIANNGDNMYAIAMGGGASTANVHIHGCRFGLDADGVTVKRFQKSLVSYGNKTAGYLYIGVAPKSANPRAQFNLIMGSYILSDLGSAGDPTSMYISGNFLNVFPDGMHDFNVDGLTHADGVDHIVEALFEFGGTGTNSVFGTDGDGVNDADERNIIGGVTAANDGNVWEAYGSGPQGLRMSGNYFGVAVDGVTRFNNGGPGMLWVDIHSRNNSGLILGSDFDGVSDDLEANLLYWNTPFTTLWGDPSTNANNLFSAEAFFVGPPKNPSQTFTGFISCRGNVMVNNLTALFSYADGLGDKFLNFQAYEAPFMNTASLFSNDDLLPKLSASSTVGDIIGTCPAPNPTVYTIGTNSASYTNLFIDLYELDPEGWANGQKFHLLELTDNSTYTNGFAQGKRYLGTLVDNGPLDRDPAVGSFNFNASALGIAPGTKVTAVANYSISPAGTHNGRTHSSDFSYPVTLRVPLKITSVTQTGNKLALSWTGGAAPYTLQKRSPITGAWTTVSSTISGTSTTDTISGSQAYYRVLGN